jgi:hypothetical protein
MEVSEARQAYDGGAHPSILGTKPSCTTSPRHPRRLARLRKTKEPRNLTVIGQAAFRDRGTPGRTADTEDAAMTKPSQSAKLRVNDPRVRTEAEMARDPDALAGRAMVEARVARCTADEQAAFWAAVRRCFGGPAPEAAA